MRTRAIRATTPRLRLRRLCRDDAEDFFAIFGDPEIARYDDFEPTARADLGREMADMLRGYRVQPRDAHYAVALRDDGKMVGVLYVQATADGIFVGYHFNRAFHGQGFAHEAMQALLQCLAGPGRVPVRAKVDPANARSLHLLRKLGFHLERIGEAAPGKPEHVYRCDLPRRAPAAADSATAARDR